LHRWITEELRDIEQQVNDEIRLNTCVETGVMSLEEAFEFRGAGVFRGQVSGEQRARGDHSRSAARRAGFIRKNFAAGRT